MTEKEAFPINVLSQHSIAARPGMSFREYIAVAAMQGILANTNYNTPVPILLARESLTQADALIWELEND